MKKRDWRRVALALARATRRAEKAEAELARLRAQVSAPVLDVEVPAEPAEEPSCTDVIARLRRVCSGDCILGRGPTDMGYAVDLLLDPRTHHTVAFALTQNWRMGTTGAGTGEAPARPVEWWAAGGWDTRAKE
jgi:hypothetical protein